MSLRRLIEEAKQLAGAIPTGFPSLDEALGIGGYPVGRIVELISEDLGVAAAVALRGVANAQEMSQGDASSTAWVDESHLFDPAIASSLGVDVSRMLYTAPPSTLEGFDQVNRLVSTSQLRLIVVDLGNGAEGPRSATTGDFQRFLRRITAIGARTGTTLLFLTRPLVFGAQRPSSNSLKFYSSVRIKLTLIDDGVYQAKVLKNKLAPPFQSAEIKP